MTDLETLQFNLALVGASSLKGKEVKTLLQERGFPVGRLSLLDTEEAHGQLTEFDEEPAIILPVTRDSFRDMRFAVFASPPSFTEPHWQMAESAGCEIIDLSIFLDSHPGALVRAPLVESLCSGQGSRNRDGLLTISAHPVAMALAGILGCLSRSFEVVRCAATVLESVSERGKPGVEELSRQTINLLAFQEIPKDVFGAQVAFNFLSTFGSERDPVLQESQARIARHVRGLLGGRAPQPAIRLLQAPIFYGHAFSCFVELAEPASPESIEDALQQKPFNLSRDPDFQPDVVLVAGSNEILLGAVEPDASVPAGFWIWGTLDNVRLAALNAVQIAEEKVFASTGRAG